MSTLVHDAGSATAVASVRLADRGLRHEARAVRVVWQRDLLRFRTDRSRLVSSFVQPLLFLFVLGKGLGAGAGGTGSYSTFLFPGVLATSVVFTAVFSAISIVWDREAGFLREMLVAPVSRHSIVLGKCLAAPTRTRRPQRTVGRTHLGRLARPRLSMRRRSGRRCRPPLTPDSGRHS